jgi:selenocysteine-specific elongation factor
MSAREKEQFIVGTAGHIDHGKTSLVKALTGIDADTLPDEKRRGITIELGFVFLDDDQNDKQVMFIDVPGHEKLVRTMVAGASNIDAVMLVIAADEGINLQTIEHYDVVKLLDISAGVIVLTKTDLVDTARLTAVTGEVKEFVKGTFLENAPVVPVSSKTKEGLDTLVTVLRELSSQKAPRRDSGIFRMPVDRVFTMEGFGVVVAGTVLSGHVKAGDVVEVYPDRFKAAVRGVQVHHHTAQESRIGLRTALNLRDVKKSDLYRGQCVAAPGSLISSSRLDGRIHLLNSYSRGLKNGDRVRLHVGTAEMMCRAVLLDCDVLKPGDDGLVQFVLDSPTAVLPRDRFVIRSFSPVETIGGGIILDAVAHKHKRSDESVAKQLEYSETDLQSLLEQALIKSGFQPLTTADLVRQSGEDESTVSGMIKSLAADNVVTVLQDGSGEKYIHSRMYTDALEQMVATVREYLAGNTFRHFMPFSELRSRMSRTMDKRVFDLLAAEAEMNGKLERRSGKITLPGYDRPWKEHEKEVAEAITAAFHDAGYATPLENDMCSKLRMQPARFRNIMQYLVDREILVRLNEKVTYHADTIDKARAVVSGYISEHGSMTVADLRDILGVSRKYTLAIMEYFDTIGVTRRVGDARVLKQQHSADPS